MKRIIIILTVCLLAATCLARLETYKGKELKLNTDENATWQSLYEDDIGKLKTLWDPSNTILVAQSGGDFDTITSAIISIQDSCSTNPYTVLVMPGIYEERVTLNKDYVALIGCGPDACMIKKSVTDDSGWNANAVMRITKNGVMVSGFVVEQLNAGTISVALYISGTGNSVRIFNCDFKGPTRDVVLVDGGAALARFYQCNIHGQYDVYAAYKPAELYNCKIDSSNYVSSSAVLWFYGGGHKLYNCDIIGNASTVGGTTLYGDGNTEVFFKDCRFKKGTGYMPICHSSCSGADTVRYSNCLASAFGASAPIDEPQIIHNLKSRKMTSIDDINLWSGFDAKFYSDAGSTIKGSIDSATGNVDFEGYGDFKDGIKQDGTTRVDASGNATFAGLTVGSLAGILKATAGAVSGNATVNNLAQMTANYDAGDYEFRAKTFNADIATGTAPLTVASTTKVANLNADQVDGYSLNQGVQTTDSPTFEDMTLAGQDITLGGSGEDGIIHSGDEKIKVQGGNAAKGVSVDIYSYDGDAADGAIINMFGLGNPDASNKEFLHIEMKSSVNSGCPTFSTKSAGTGSERDIYIDPKASGAGMVYLGQTGDGDDVTIDDEIFCPNMASGAGDVAVERVAGSGQLVASIACPYCLVKVDGQWTTDTTIMYRAKKSQTVSFSKLIHQTFEGWQVRIMEIEEESSFIDWLRLGARATKVIGGQAYTTHFTWPIVSGTVNLDILSSQDNRYVRLEKGQGFQITFQTPDINLGEWDLIEWGIVAAGYYERY